ncbi:MAG TPA: MFS transporter [Nonomuraea sp.]|nr:MFS transporter [Nonomuraea sp.]
MTIYLVAMVIATMLVSRLSGRWGNVGAYLLGFGVFLAGSLVCAVSPVMPVLLAGRAAQGLGAGLLSGLGFAAIRSALPERLWTRGNALMSAMYGVGNFVGPALGGLFAQFGAWRLAFVAMAVIAAVCCLFVPRVLPRGERSDVRAPVPLVSLLLVTAATAAVSLAGVLPGAMAMASGIVVALLLVAGFVVYERRSELRVFPRTTYLPGSPLKWVYLTLALLAFGVAVESFVPLFGQRLGGLAPAVAGFRHRPHGEPWPFRTCPHRDRVRFEGDVMTDALSFPMARAAGCPFDPSPELSRSSEQTPVSRVRLWDYFWADHYDVKIQAYGRTGGDAQLHIITDDATTHRFAALYSTDGRVTGAVTWNLPQQARALRHHVAERTPWRQIDSWSVLRI